MEEYIFEESRVYKDQQVRNESAGVKQQNKTYAQASAGTAELAIQHRDAAVAGVRSALCGKAMRAYMNTTVVEPVNEHTTSQTKRVLDRLQQMERRLNNKMAASVQQEQPRSMPMRRAKRNMAVQQQSPRRRNGSESDPASVVKKLRSTREGRKFYNVLTEPGDNDDDDMDEDDQEWDEDEDIQDY